MLPHYPICIGRQSASPHSQFSSLPLIPFPLDLPVLPHLSIFHHWLLTLGSSHLVSGTAVVSGGGKVLAHATSVSPWPRLVKAAVTNT